MNMMRNNDIFDDLVKASVAGWQGRTADSEKITGAPGTPAHEAFCDRVITALLRAPAVRLQSVLAAHDTTLGAHFSALMYLRVATLGIRSDDFVNSLYVYVNHMYPETTSTVPKNISVLAKHLEICLRNNNSREQNTLLDRVLDPNCRC